MKRRLSTAAYAIAVVVAGYASYDLAVEAKAIYHFGAVVTASFASVLFAFLSVVFSETIAKVIDALARERQYSWPATIARVLGFSVGLAAGSVGMAAALSNLPAWQVCSLMLVSSIGWGTFCFVSAFGPSPLERSPSY